MRNLKLLSIPILLMFLCSCSTGGGSSSTPSSDTSSEESSESSSSTSSSSSEKQWVKYVSSRNPMNEPKVGQQYYLNHIGDIYNTWKDLQGHGVTIAVIDTGFKYDHEDFVYEDGTSKVSELSASFTTSGTTTTKVVGRDKVSSGVNNNAHGTFCAGVAAAGINGKGVIGIAPLAELMLLKTDAHPLSICEAFKYAADNGARVITISIGDYTDYSGDLKGWAGCGQNLATVFDNAVNYAREKGTVVISAAGNGGGSARATEYTFPGGTTGVIGAGGLAANSSTERWAGSSYNSSAQYMFCDVFAPSDGMFGCTDHYDDYHNYYSYAGGWDGTSFASPVVAGIAALYFEKNPNNTVEQFENDLYASCVSFGTPSQVGQNGHGRVDVGKLMGTTLSGNVTAKVKNSGDLYAYYWKSGTTINNTWPGTYIGTGDDKTYTITMDASKYDSVILNTGGSDPYQTVDLSISSFIYGNTYNADEVTNFSEKVVIGTYIAN